MDWLAQLLKALFDAILSKYGDLVGKSVGQDAPSDRNLLRRAGTRISDWVQSRRAGERRQPDEGRPGLQDKGVHDD
jgi:hypothetical protein